MDTVKNFDILICGETSDDMFDFRDVILNLTKKIELMTEIIVNYNWASDKSNIEIPFYGRNVLESSMTALLGRIDPFRLITVYKVQSDSSYDLGKRALNAVEWTGDIISIEKPSDKYHFKKKKDSFDRALLGDYMGDIVWKPAFNALSNYMAENQYESEWLRELLDENEAANFEKAKSMAVRLFSVFSKGVHSECLIDINNMLDIITLKSSIKDMFKLCSSLGLVSHFVGFMNTTIVRDRALDIFFNVEEMIGNV